jgi:putative ABC transport system substrate-binding protein
MHRRRFIGAVGCTLLSTMQASLAQQPANVRRIGILTGGTIASIPAPRIEDLRNFGWIEGRNLIIERRGGNGNADAVPALARELVQLNVDVIVTFGAVAGLAAKNATRTIPIVATSGDPVRFGLVDNLQHPGGNITGIALIAPELAAKRLELLRELLPTAVRIGELVDPANRYWQSMRKEHEAAYRSFGMQPIFVNVTDPNGLEAAMAEVARQRAQALYVRGDPIFSSHQAQIARLAVRHMLPTIAEERRFTEDGVLVSYGPLNSPLDNRIAEMVDKILKGANPGDLPIEQPKKFELVFNTKTAKAIGLTIPQGLLLRADEVIQ